MVEHTKPIAESNTALLFWINIRTDWEVTESYQSESDLERELVQDLVNQGYQFLPEVKDYKKRCLPMSACSCKR